MIYFTTFIFTLLLSHIACATPACGDVTPTEELNDPVYADAQHAVPFLPIVLDDISWSNYYDNKTGDTSKVTCSNLAKHYPHFGNFPHFPYIGGIYLIKSSGSSLCGSCWSLTNLITRTTIFITFINSAKFGSIVIPKEAFDVLKPVPGKTEVKHVSPLPCFHKS